MFSKLVEAAQNNVFGRPLVASCQESESTKQIMPSRPAMAATGELIDQFEKVGPKIWRLGIGRAHQPRRPISCLTMELQNL